MTKEEIKRRIREIDSEIRKLRSQISSLRKLQKQLEEVIRHLEWQIARIREQLDRMMDSLKRKAARIEFNSRLKEEYVTQASEIIHGTSANESLEKLDIARHRCIEKVSENGKKISAFTNKISALEKEKEKLKQLLSEMDA